MKTPLNILAQGAVARAKRKGILVPEPCEVCGAKRVHGHHYLGYARENWLKVQWLCASHHEQAHFNNPTQTLKYYLISRIAGSEISQETLLQIQKIIKLSSNEISS
jgi:hypothetical protein